MTFITEGAKPFKKESCLFLTYPKFLYSVKNIECCVSEALSDCDRTVKLEGRIDAIDSIWYPQYRKEKEGDLRITWSGTDQVELGCCSMLERGVEQQPSPLQVGTNPEGSTWRVNPALRVWEMRYVRSYSLKKPSTGVSARIRSHPVRIKEQSVGGGFTYMSSLAMVCLAKFLGFRVVMA